MASFIAAASLPGGGVRVFPSERRPTLNLRGLPETCMRQLDVEGLPFDDAIDVDIERQGETPWEFLLISKIDAPLTAGDVIHVRFWARAVLSMTGSARLSVCVEDYRGDQPGKFAEVPVTVGTQWRCVDLPVVAPRGYAADQWHFSIRLGFAQQRVQIGGVEVLNFGRSVSIDALPRIRSSYAGREPAASWREEALSRIEELRKGISSCGSKTPRANRSRGASIRATLARHRFGFGSCVSMTLLQAGPDADRYRQTLASLFSCAVVENELKWPAIREHQYANSDAIVDWLREAGLPTRGHVLLWPSPRYMPSDVIALASDKPRFARAIAEHITESVSRYRGRLEDWDVINEPYAHHFAMDVLGESAMVEWFQLAHAADPDAKLYINDYEILESGDELNTPHQNHFYSIARYLKDHGAPLHGVGIQGHFGSNITCPENVLKILDRFAAIDVRIKITELDVQISDESLQADYFRDLLICLFSHPSVDAVMQWGFWEGSHWIPSTAMFRQDWSIRPHGQVFLDWVHGMWKTDVALQSDKKGDVRFRGFFGDYMLQAVVGGDTVQRRVSLSATGHSATLTL